MVLLILFPEIWLFSIFMIYIPLWFYLYEVKTGRYPDVVLFTFHYGSTYTIKAMVSFRDVKIFTFHYGSTYTAEYFGVSIEYFYLHSTMVLLIPYD